MGERKLNLKKLADRINTRLSDLVLLPKEYGLCYQNKFHHTIVETVLYLDNLFYLKLIIIKIIFSKYLQRLNCKGIKSKACCVVYFE